MSFYSKNKGGLDDVTQYRAILRPSNKRVGWEEKVVNQKCKILLSKSFISRRFVQWSSLTHFSHLGSLDHFRATLNEIEGFGDFVSTAIKGLLQYRSSIMQNRGGRDAVCSDLAAIGSRGADVAAIPRLTSQIVKTQAPPHSILKLAGRNTPPPSDTYSPADTTEARLLVCIMWYF